MGSETMIIRDDRKKTRIDPNECHVGDLYKPWYFFQNNECGSPCDVNQACLIYKVEKTTLDPKSVVSTSFLKIPKSLHWDEYFNEPLTEDIKNNGQHVPIVCTKHYTKDSPLEINFLEDPSLTKVRCFEGHHRLMSCLHLDIPVEAEVYHLFHMDEPIDWSKHYRSIYDDSFWSSYQTLENRQTWFNPLSFEDPIHSDKYRYLKKCFNFINDVGQKPSLGIDIGCAEGSYTFFAQREMGCKMTGVDSEGGRIIRGLIMKSKLQNKDIDFVISNWSNVSHDQYDFAMALSILHHMKQGEDEEFLNQLVKNKKSLIIECRVSPKVSAINSGSMVAINTQEYYEDIFKRSSMKYKHIDTWTQGGRMFYALWR